MLIQIWNRRHHHRIVEFQSRPAFGYTTNKPTSKCLVRERKRCAERHRKEQPVAYANSLLRWESITYCYVCARACVRVGARERGRVQTHHGTRMRHSVSGLLLHHLFRHYLIKDKIFEKKLLNIKCVFWFSLQLLYQTFLILRII